MYNVTKYVVIHFGNTSLANINVVDLHYTNELGAMKLQLQLLIVISAREKSLSFFLRLQITFSSSKICISLIDNRCFCDTVRQNCADGHNNYNVLIAKLKIA